MVSLCKIEELIELKHGSGYRFNPLKLCLQSNLNRNLFSKLERTISLFVIHIILERSNNLQTWIAMFLYWPFTFKTHSFHQRVLKYGDGFNLLNIGNSSWIMAQIRKFFDNSMEDF